MTALEGRECGIRPEGFTDEYRETVCKMGQGEECCRYLTCGARGFECAKHTSFAWQIDRKEDMRARGDNCDGVYNLRPAYRLLRDRFEHKAGATIYTAKGHDYGCARDDEYATGKPHTSMTLEPSGDYPFFTVPNEDFEPTSDTMLAERTKELPK